MARAKSALQTGEQPRHPGIVYRGRLPGKPENKAFADMTWTEKWLQRRYRWLVGVMPGRLAILEAGFQNFLKVADKDYYEFTESEATAVVERLQAYVDAIYESLKSGTPVHPSNLQPVILDCDLKPPANAVPDPLADL